VKLLFVTDTHLRGTAPEARVDDFAETVKAKLREVVSLAEEHGVSAVLHGGDLFDAPEPGLAQVGEYLEILRGLPCPLYIVPGNHDVYGHNPATLPRTLLGLLVRLGFARPLSAEPVYLDGGGVRVQLTGRGFHAEIDRRDPAADYAVEKRGCDAAVHVAHGMVLPDGAALPPGIPCTRAADVLAATGADLTLVGHWHFPFAVESGGKAVVNPGSLVRLTAHPADAERAPQAVLIEIGGAVKWRFVPLASARPGAEVLSRARLDAARLREERRAAFLAALEGMRGAWAAAADPADVLRRVLARFRPSPRAEAEVWRRFEEAKKALGRG